MGQLPPDQLQSLAASDGLVQSVTVPQEAFNTSNEG
jgi:hypothetical protein